MATLGKRIRAVRGKRSQNVFAASLGISKGALVSYELDRSSPNAKILMAICSLEQVDIKWLLRACLETHLSIMKRFNSMLAMAI